jgi:hypothetical protein
MTAHKPPPSKTAAQIQREKRLAEALRANLRRRKMADSSGMAAREEEPAATLAGPEKGGKAES